MNAELEKRLYDKYPGIFRQKDLKPSQTCMCWGIATGDGWYDLIEDLCNKIQTYIDKNNLKQVEALQVKEKFGGLRFYIGGAPDKIYDYIWKAEEESLKTCEECGTKDNVKQRHGGWIVTLCDKCLDKRDKEYRKSLEEVREELNEKRQVPLE